MDSYFVDLSAQPFWAPLQQLGALRFRRGIEPWLEQDEFMFIGVARRSGRVDVMLYKSIRTRAYLCLDRSGHAYRCTRVGNVTALDIETCEVAIKRVAQTTGRCAMV